MDIHKLRIQGFFAGLLALCLVLSGCRSGGRGGMERDVPADRSAAPGMSAGAHPSGASGGRLLVKLKSGADPDEVFQAVGGETVRYYQETDWYLINYDRDISLGSALALLVQNKHVLLAEADYPAQAFDVPVVPDDPAFTGGRQWGLESINAAAGWEYTTGSEEIVIAVLDTGIDHTHPDLAAKVIDGYNAITSEPGKPGDDNGHGTHVAGIAGAATNNGTGMAGVAWECRLMPVKVLDFSGYGSYSGIAGGVLWAVNNGADVINLSVGGWFYTRSLQDAVEYALENNVIVVAAAGNYSKFTDVAYPAAYPGVISVGAVKYGVTGETKARFSAEGNHLFLAAPGQTIYSTVPCEAPGGVYDYWSGTSMAAPFVSGAVALIKFRWPEFDVNHIHSQLRQTAGDLGSPGWDKETGWGLLDLRAALVKPEPNLFGVLDVTVKDREGVPVAYARILLREVDTEPGRGRDLNVLADKNGRALFMARPAGSYTVKVEKDGRRGEASVEVAAGGETEITLTIQ